MGQGQAEIAMKLLSDCAKNGDWLCLKNLHLVTAWLPKLEKVCSFVIRFVLLQFQACDFPLVKKINTCNKVF